MNDDKQKFSKLIIPSIISWLMLILLTFISVYMTVIVESRTMFIGCVLITVALKGQQIIDIFMELKNAPKRWRLLLLSYAALMPLIIAFIYLF